MIEPSEVPEYIKLQSNMILNNNALEELIAEHLYPNLQRAIRAPKNLDVDDVNGLLLRRFESIYRVRI